MATYKTAAMLLLLTAIPIGVSMVARALRFRRTPCKTPFVVENTQEDDDYVVPVSPKVAAEDFPRLAKQLAAQARHELYLTSGCEAEIIQLREWAVRTMTLMDVRKADQFNLLPYIQRLAYLETRAERLAREETITNLYQQRLEATNNRIWLYDLPSLLHPLGVLVREPSVSRR